MEKTTAFQLSMQFPRLFAALSVIFLLVLWRLQAWAVIYRRRSRIKREHGCQDPAKFPNKDPIFGLDVWLDTYQSMKHHQLLPKIASRYKTAGANTFCILIAGKYRISTIEPENMKAMLSTKFTSFIFPARRTYVLKQFIGDAIFASHGPTWQRSRATIRPHLTKDSFIDSEMSRFEKYFGRMLKAIPRDCSTVDLQPLFFLFTMNAAIEMLTGKDLQSEEQLALAKDGNYGNIVELFDDAQRMLAFCAVLPYGSLPANEEQHIKRCQEWVDRCVIQAIKEHKSGKVAGDGEKLSFLQELVRETDDHVWIRGELIAVLIVGRDTTASTLSSLWFVLAKRPDIVAKLQAEVAELNGERPGFTRLKQMEYVQHTIQELLRLYPAVPANGLEATEDTVLPVGGGADGKSPIFIKKGQIVNHSVYAMHRRKDIFGPDAEVFRPERWEDKSLRSGWGYLPFNGGPRVCLGQQFALTEIAYTTVRLLQEFQAVESRDASPWQEKWMTSCSVLTGCKVSMIPYENVV